MPEVISRRSALTRLMSAPAAALAMKDVTLTPMPEPIPIPLTDEDGFDWWSHKIFYPATFFELGIAWTMCDWTCPERFTVVYFENRAALNGFASSPKDSCVWVRPAVQRFLDDGTPRIGQQPGFLVVVTVQEQPVLGRAGARGDGAHGLQDARRLRAL